MKICTKCGVVQELDYFTNDKRAKDGKHSWCRACTKFWRDTNKERVALGQKNWELNNIEKRRQYRQAYAKQNADKIRASATLNKENRHKSYKKWAEKNKKQRSEYRQAHKEQFVAYRHKRRALINKPGNYSSKEWKILCESFGNACVSCYDVVKLTVDHIIPISCGGSNTIDNIQPLCGSCNSSKGTKTLNYKIWFMVA